MSRTSSFPLYDEMKFGGKLADLLRQWRDEDKSLDDITYLLRSEHEVHVSRSTVKRWVDQAEAAA